ncbi:hypothetical protein F5Y10DRAFT_99933 [Nemania abortiva]|nr:hypothetical protein F5Y10DRAFT_99933 [Nemania abortiva]
MTTLYPAVTSSGGVISFIPLTTTFTPSAECSGYFRLNGPSLVAFDPGYGLDIDTDVICVPSAVTTWWEQARLGVNGDDHTAISIGPLTCPYKWETVATSIENGSSTVAMCCPSGYYLENGIPGSIAGDCLSDVSSGMRLTYASTSADNSEVWYTKTTSLKESSTVGAIAIVGWNIELPTPTRIETTSSSATIPLNPISTSTSSLPSPTTSSSDSSQNTTRLAIGIGVGVGLGVIGTASLLVTVWLMRRRRRRGNVGAVQGAILAQQPPHYAEPYKHELYDPRTGRHELQGGFQGPVQGQYQVSHPPAELHE